MIRMVLAVIALKTIVLLGLSTNVLYMMNPWKCTGVADELDYWMCLWLYMSSDAVLHFLVKKKNITVPGVKCLGKGTIFLSVANIAGPVVLPLFPGIPGTEQLWAFVGKICISMAILTVLLFMHRKPVASARPEDFGKGGEGII